MTFLSSTIFCNVRTLQINYLNKAEKKTATSSYPEREVLVSRHVEEFLEHGIGEEVSSKPAVHLHVRNIIKYFCFFLAVGNHHSSSSRSRGLWSEIYYSGSRLVPDEEANVEKCLKKIIIKTIYPWLGESTSVFCCQTKLVKHLVIFLQKDSSLFFFVFLVASFVSESSCQSGESISAFLDNSLED